jgi:hypothetical protein
MRVSLSVLDYCFEQEGSVYGASLQLLLVQLYSSRVVGY